MAKKRYERTKRVEKREHLRAEIEKQKQNIASLEGTILKSLISKGNSKSAPSVSSDIKLDDLRGMTVLNKRVKNN